MLPEQRPGFVARGTVDGHQWLRLRRLPFVEDMQRIMQRRDGAMSPVRVPCNGPVPCDSRRSIRATPAWNADPKCPSRAGSNRGFPSGLPEMGDGPPGRCDAPGTTAPSPTARGFLFRFDTPHASAYSGGASRQVVVPGIVVGPPFPGGFSAIFPRLASLILCNSAQDFACAISSSFSEERSNVRNFDRHREVVQ